jgi:hypothetical protein
MYNENYVIFKGTKDGVTLSLTQRYPLKPFAHSWKRR